MKNKNNFLTQKGRWLLATLTLLFTLTLGNAWGTMTALYDGTANVTVGFRNVDYASSNWSGNTKETQQTYKNGETNNTFRVMSIGAGEGYQQASSAGQYGLKLGNGSNQGGALCFYVSAKCEFRIVASTNVNGQTIYLYKDASEYSLTTSNYATAGTEVSSHTYSVKQTAEAFTGVLESGYYRIASGTNKIWIDTIKLTTYVPVTGISITPSSANVTVGRQVQLSATASPTTASLKSVTWSVKSGGTYASVNSKTGVVRGLAAGDAVITATANDGSGVTQDINVSVAEIDCDTYSGNLFQMEVLKVCTCTIASGKTFALTDGDNYSVYGGAIALNNKGGSQKVVMSKVQSSQLQWYLNTADVGFDITLADCNFKKGDIISISSTESNELYLNDGSAKGASTDASTSSLSYTVDDGDAFIGKNKVVVWKASTNTYIRSITITRPAPSCTNVSAPTALTCSAQAVNSLTYTWTKAEHASAYTATLYSNSGCTSEVESKELGDVATVTFNTGLSASTDYWCKVQSKGDGSTYCAEGGVTSAVQGTTATPSCGDVTAPTLFMAGTITADGATFTITDDADAFNYELYVSDESTTPESSATATYTSTAKSKEVTGLTSGTTYYAWVRSVCDETHKSSWVALNTTSFKVRTNPTASFADAEYVIGASAIDVAANFSSNSEAAVVYELKEEYANVTLSGSMFSATVAGEYVVVANQAGNATYMPISKEATVTVVPAPTHLVENRLNVTSGDWSSTIYTNDGTNISNLVEWQIAEGQDRTAGVTDKQSIKNNRTHAIGTKATRNEGSDGDYYMYLSFKVADGKRLKLSAVNIPVFGITDDKTTEVEIEDATSTKITVNGTITHDADGNGFGTYTFSEAPYLKGVVTMKMWAYGATNGYRMKSPIYLDGTISDIPQTYAVSYAKGDEGATGTMTDSNSPYEEGAEVTLLANTFGAPEGKTFGSWEVRDVTNDTVVAVANGKFEMPASAVTVTAQWVSANKVAKIGENYYENFADAIAAVTDGQTIQLLADCSYGSEWIIDGMAITLDLNGKNLTGPASGDAVTIKNGAILTIMDSKAEAAATAALPDVLPSIDVENGNAITYPETGKFSAGKWLINVYAGSQFIMNSGWLVGGEAAVWVTNSGVVTMNNGVLEALENAVVMGPGNLNKGGYTINIHGGILLGHMSTDGIAAGYSSMAVYHPNEGTLTIDGGTLVSENGPGVVVRGGTSNITGGTIIAQGTGGGKCGDANAPLIEEVGVAYDFRANYPGENTLHATISGDANISGADGAVVGIYDNDTPDATEEAAVAISGGTFNTPVAGALCAENYAPKNNGDGTYGVKPLATTIDFEAFIDANGTSGNWATYLSDHAYAISSTSDVSLDGGDSGNKPADKGLKIKKADRTITFEVAAGKLVILKVGSLNGGAQIKVNDGEYTDLTGANPLSTGASVYTYYYSDDVATYVIKTKADAYNIIQSITITDPYVVTYNANGGDAVAPATFYGTALTLPNATKGTDSFKGWYNAAEGGSKVGDANASFIPTKDTTLYAHWESISTDARLASITFSSAAGTLSPAFDPEVVNYTYTMPYPTADIPTITGATSVNANAKEPVIVQQASAWNETAIVRGVAQSDDTKAYNITMKIAPKDGVSLIETKVTGKTSHGDVTGLIGGDAAVSLEGSNLKLGKGNYVGVTLSGTNKFQAGDVVVINVINVQGATGFTLYTTNDADSVLIIDTRAGSAITTGLHRVTIPATYAGGTTPYEGTSSIYLLRANNDFTANMNPCVDSIAVYRIMNPVLKSITFNSTDVAVASTTVAATLPYGTNLGTMTVTPTIWWNGAGTAVVTSNEGNWVEGANTFVVTDKDGDNTTYTITLSIADHYEAMIVGGDSYSTLAGAVAAANANDVVKLLDNVDVTAAGLTIGTNMTLDLNGFNIKAGEQLANNINVPAGVKLTLVDNSANAEGKIYTEEAYTGSVNGYGVVRVSGEFLMQSGNIYTVIESDPANLGQFAVVLGAGGKATIEGGQIKAGWYAISNNGNNTGSTIIVSGGELISTADFAIYNPAKESTVTVSGGVVYGAAGGIAMNRGELTVTGGTITSKDQGSTGTWGDGTGGLSNAAISASGKYESVEVEISGGTIIAEGTAVMITNGTTNPVEVAISGGQFSHVVPAEYCADGFAPVTEPNAQGKYEVEDKRIYIFNGTTSSATMATSPSGAIAWENVGSAVGSPTGKNGTYDEVSYVKAVQIGNSTTTKHFRIDVAVNNNAKIEVIGMSNSNSGDTKIRHAWLTNSTDKGEIANAIASLESDGYNPAYFATDWLEEGSYYLHADNTVNLFLIRVTSKAVPAKCEVPTITTQPATKTDFGAGNMTATVVAEVSDGGTLTYQWYNAADDSEVVGATAATLSTADEGTYYVIVTNTLAEHRDNSIKSDEATLAHRVLNDATLSALSYGGTAITLEDGVYEYDVYLAMGTTDVPTLAATATMDGYATVDVTDATAFVSYEAVSNVLVTAEDGVTQNTYTVHFIVDHLYTTLVPVTDNTTWNWTGSEEATINDVANKGLILANYIEGPNFEKIEGKEGERARRNQNDGVYQGSYLHFNTTVYGKVKFYFRSPSSGEECVITIKNNGKEIRVDSTENSFKWSREVVVYGDVVIEMENKKEGKTETRVQQIVFTAMTPGYSRTVTNNIGTLCVDHNVLAGGAVGATFYQIASRNELYDYKIDFEEVLPNEELKAGEPYIFQSTTGRIDLYFGLTEAPEPVAVRGMIGNYAASSLAITEENKASILYIAQNKLWTCENLVGTGLTLNEHRAYIDMRDVPTYEEYHAQPQPNNAPVRRRVTLGRDVHETITGVENAEASEKPVKMIIDGQLFILRGDKMFDATGRLVK